MKFATRRTLASLKLLISQRNAPCKDVRVTGSLLEGKRTSGRLRRLVCPDEFVVGYGVRGGSRGRCPLSGWCGGLASPDFPSLSRDVRRITRRPPHRPARGPPGRC